MKGEIARNSDKDKSVWAAGKRLRERASNIELEAKKKNRMCDCLGDPGESTKDNDKERDISAEIQWS